MDLRGVYSVLKLWYCHAYARLSNLSLSNMAKVAKYYATLYHQEDLDPPGQLLSNHIYPFQIHYEVP